MELANFLFGKFDINRSDYEQVKFSLDNKIYVNLEIKIQDIGITDKHLTEVEFTTFSTFPRHPCTLKDRDLNIKYLDGILFKILLLNKMRFVLESKFNKTVKNGRFYIELLKIVMTQTDRPIEINTIQEKIEKLESLNHSYQSAIHRIFQELFLL